MEELARRPETRRREQGTLTAPAEQRKVQRERAGADDTGPVAQLENFELCPQSSGKRLNDYKCAAGLGVFNITLQSGKRLGRGGPGMDAERPAKRLGD